MKAKAIIVESVEEAVDREELPEGEDYSTARARKRLKAQREFAKKVGEALDTYKNRDPQVQYGHVITPLSNQNIYTALITVLAKPDEICGKCEANAPLDGDYLCKECR